MFIYNLYELALRSPAGGVVNYYYYHHYYCYYFNYLSNFMITETLSERFQEIYHYSESLVFKTVNRPGTNILVSSTYAVLLQLSEGSKYPKRMTNFGEQERTSLGESRFLRISPAL